MRIKKVINNNVLCTIDERGNEMIVTGKGIGFSRHVGEFVNEATIEKIYRMEDKGWQKKLRELVSQIPIEHLDLTQRLITSIRALIRQELNESLLITLADHISFAIQRQAKGLTFENPLTESIMRYYPMEYHLGQQCLKQIEKKLGTTLHPDEASFIALHIVNAELNTSMSDMHEMASILEGAVKLTQEYYGVTFDKDSIDWNRFVVHLRYLTQRLYAKEQTGKGDLYDEDFRRTIRETCGEHAGCADKIAQYILQNYGKVVSEDEKIFLTIHLKRIFLSHGQQEQ